MTRIIALATTLAVGATAAFAGNVLPAPVEPEPAAPVATGGMGQGAYIAAGLGALALGGLIYAIADDDDNDDDDNGSSSTTTTN